MTVETFEYLKVVAKRLVWAQKAAILAEELPDYWAVIKQFESENRARMEKLKSGA
jgi:hypothetical protein